MVVLPLGFGIVTGILLLNQYGQYLPRRRVIEGGMIALGLMLGLLSVAGPISRLLQRADAPGGLDLSGVTSLLTVVVVIALAAGIFYAWVAIPSQTQLQEDLPEDVRGRVFGILNMLVSVASFLPIIIVGPISDLVGTTWVLISVAVIVLMSGVASVVVRGPLAASEGHNAADPKTVDPIAAALGADRPTWHERRRPRPSRPSDGEAGRGHRQRGRGRPRTRRPGRSRVGDAARPPDHRTHRDACRTGGVRLGRGDRRPGRADRLRRLRGRARDPGRSVHPADRAGARRGRDPGTDRRAPPPRPGGASPPPGRPHRDREPRCRHGEGRRRTCRARGPRCLARRARLERRPMGSLADRSRPRAGGARSPCDALGARPSRAPGQPRRPPDRGRLGRDGRSCRWRHPTRPRRVARGRPVRERRPPGLDPRAARPSRPISRPTSRPSGGNWSRSGSSPATTRRALPPTRTSPSRTRPTRTSRTRAVCRCASMRACAATASTPRSRAASGVAPCSGPIRRGAPGSGGRSASPTAHWARGPRPCSRTSSPSPISRSRPSAAAASGSPRPRSWRRSRHERPPPASRRRSTRSATPRPGPRSTC